MGKAFSLGNQLSFRIWPENENGLSFARRLLELGAANV